MTQALMNRAAKLQERLSAINELRKSAPGQATIKALCDRLTRDAVRDATRRPRKRANQARDNVGRFTRRRR